MFLKSGLIPLTVILCPTKVSSYLNYLHFVDFNLRFTSLIFWSIALICLVYSSFILKWIIISSRYTSINFLKYCLNTLFINLWKVASALHSPNDMTLNWYCLVLIKNAIFSIFCFLNHTYQYADTRSKVINYLLF